MSLISRDNYWDDPALKTRFISFVNGIFRLDLTLWDRMGFWDSNYRPFSLFDGDRLVSSLCLYSMPMTVAGRDCLAGQFSAVATLPEYRRQGLGAQLMHQAAQWAADTHAFFFLFANDDAFPFYRQCGYRLIGEHRNRILIDGRRSVPGAVQLNMEDKGQRDLVYRYACERCPVSNRLGVRSPKLFMFWCLYGLRDAIYHIPDLDVLVLCRRTDRLLTIFDIVGRELPTFATIYPYISDSDDQAAEFQFMPDRLNLETAGEFIPVVDNGTHLLGDFPLEAEPFLFPLTSHA